MENKKDRSGLIIKIVAISLIVAVVLGLAIYMIVNQPKPRGNLDLSLAGKYNLTEITGLTDKKTGKAITPKDYEYNYIILGTDGRYEIANKYKNKKTSQKGVWYTEGHDLYFESAKMWGLFKSTDHGTIKDNKITMVLKNDGTTVTMLLTKKSK